MSTLYPVSAPQEIGLEEQLRLEPAWTDVAAGLRQVVLGYVILIIGVAVGVALIVGSAFAMGAGGRGPVRLSVGALWQFYIGMGTLSLVGLISWGMVLAGKFKCLLNAPERQLARWFIFVCVFCTFVGPVFNAAAGLGLTEKQFEFKKGARGLQDVQFTKTGKIVHLIGFGCEMLSPLAFLLFLRAVARCLELKLHEYIMNGYIAVSIGVTAATGYLLFAPPKTPQVLLLYVICLGLGWLVCAVAYLVVTMVMRSSILCAVTRVQSPLDRR